MQVAIKRAYDSAANTDGKRVLVDRLWPRGVKKEDAKIDLWLKEVAPSTELRKWFNHQDERWAEFQQRYVAELKDNPAYAELQELAVTEEKLTLVFSTKDEEKNSAAVLQQLLSKQK